MKNQKEATYAAVKEVQDFEDGSTVILSKDEKATVRQILVEGFEANEIELKSPQADLNKYVNGLLNNWLRKDMRMNGNKEYEAKNPGSRKGQGDAMVKNLRLLKKTVTDTDAINEIEAAITARLAEIKPTITKEVDASVIPAHLQHLLPNAEGETESE